MASHPTPITQTGIPCVPNNLGCSSQLEWKYKRKLKSLSEIVFRWINFWCTNWVQNWIDAHGTRVDQKNSQKRNSEHRHCSITQEMKYIYCFQSISIKVMSKPIIERENNQYNQQKRKVLPRFWGVLSPYTLPIDRCSILKFASQRRSITHGIIS